MKGKEHLGRPVAVYTAVLLTDGTMEQGEKIYEGVFGGYSDDSRIALVRNKECYPPYHPSSLVKFID